MSLNIRLKHSASANKEPASTDLTPGELALNINNASPAGYALDDAGTVQQMFGKATEAQEGQAEIATQPEVDGGTDDERIVTPAKLSQRITDYTTNTVTPAIKVETDARTAADTAEANRRYANDNLRVLKTGDTMTGPLVLPADPANPLEAATKQYVDRRPADGAINVLINGNLQINQRNANTATVATGAYGQDRWKKTAGGMTQIVENGNYIPNVPYTLSYAGITTPVTANSPASGNWDISITHGNIPVAARFIQMERGPVATDYQLKPIGTELALCQRYYVKMKDGVIGLICNINQVVNASVGTVIGAVTTPVPMRSIPAVIQPVSQFRVGDLTGGNPQVVTGSATSNFPEVLTFTSGSVFNANIVVQLRTLDGETWAYNAEL